MLPPTATTRAQAMELQREVVRVLADSRAALDHALVTAAQIGRLLHEERARIRRLRPEGGWRRLLAACLRCSERTIDRYLKLADTSVDPAAVAGLSLRQAYRSLGVSTEPKARATSRRLPALPGHVRSAQRVLLSVRTRLRVRQMTAQQRQHLCDDLRPLHQQLCALFAADPCRSPPDRQPSQR